MLTQNDIEIMKANRSELLANRTELVTLVTLTETGSDPFTGEPITEETRLDVEAVWKKVASIANHDRSLVEGIELQAGDYRVSFNYDVPIANITTVERNGESYTLIAVDEKGIGEINRYECIARRVS
ncbi:MAG: hypothetical protein ACQEV7_07780 [Bacillota bacterium]